MTNRTQTPGPSLPVGACGGTDVGGAYPSALTLATTSVGAGSVGDSTHVAAFTVGADGRLTAKSNVAIAFPSSSAPWSLSTIPASPNVNDAEFNGSFPPGFSSIPVTPGVATPLVVIDATAPSPYSAGPATGHQFLNENTYRPSSLVSQGQIPGATGGPAGGFWPFTETGDFFFYCQISIFANYSVISSDIIFQLFVASATGGVPDRAVVSGVSGNWFGIEIGHDSTTAQRIVLYSCVNGTLSNKIITNSTNEFTIEYLGVQRIGNQITGWMATANGSWQYIGAVADYTGPLPTLVQAWSTTGAQNGTSPPDFQSPLCAVDFVRFITGSAGTPP